MKHAKGLLLVAELLRHPGRDIVVTELALAGEVQVFAAPAPSGGAVVTTGTVIPSPAGRDREQRVSKAA